MPLTASFSDVRRDLSTIADKVMTDHVQITVFRNNKPAFKIVPIDVPAEDKGYLALADKVDADYHDVFEALAHES
ncbi:type II toxin-antitoxin system prevent-host-death family antitoxin [uncultured Bifidobacterium sp.]|uniref:type II toxin-antitoxin system prevent-host-death family antitoxin n=1 Tax=uncultured Bifidobacterium sp. TaxID=165187 RepID=UPI002588789B|nr:type II toxin-antitoxin system prevent-host-death family antitoxin [uncultured Bifidobacterium sp.]